MQKLFIVISVAVTSFTVWCGYAHQPKDTCLLNLASTLLSLQLIREYAPKKTKAS